MPKGIYKRIVGVNCGHGISRGMLGHKLTDAQKEAIRQRGLGKKYCLGKKHTEETKRKMSLAKLGKPKTAEHCLNISKGHLGFKHSIESKKKMSLTRTGRKLTEDHIQHIRESHLGEKAYNYIKDRTKLKTDERLKSYDTKYKYWMLKVKKRDNWECKINNQDCKGRLESHHILNWKEHPELRYEINNGITLCFYHHPRRIEDVKNLSPYFKDLIKEIL